MAFFQYLVFDGENLPLPDSYEVELEDVEADSGGETEAGTTQRDVVRHGVVQIPVSFSVTAKWLEEAGRVCEEWIRSACSILMWRHRS